VAGINDSRSGSHPGCGPRHGRSRRDGCMFPGRLVPWVRVHIEAEKRVCLSGGETPEQGNGITSGQGDRRDLTAADVKLSSSPSPPALLGRVLRSDSDMYMMLGPGGKTIVWANALPQSTTKSSSRPPLIPYPYPGKRGPIPDWRQARECGWLRLNRVV
jgi:hypothetical protein